jgi:hypothetical protein
MVEGDVGEDGDEGVDNVGGVETTAEAYFEDGDVDCCAQGERRLRRGVFCLTREVEKREGSDDFKEAGGVGELVGFDEVAGSFVDAEVEAGEVFVGDLAAVNLDALVDAAEMGRGVEGGAIAGGGEDAGKGGGGAAFAVGSGDEDGREGELGVAEGFGKDAHMVELELAAGGTGRGRGQLLA